jgi:hypothetical protein
MVAMTDLSESVQIQASAETVYDLVSDLTRMGEWSPENRGARWLGGKSCAAVGTRFIGQNRAGPLRWFTFGRVTVADPAREFAFEITFGPMPVACWQYVFTPTEDGGCVVVESWTDRRPDTARPVLDAVFRAKRADINARGMAKTLANLKRAAEHQQVPER